MFNELTKALKDHLPEGQTMGLKKLAELFGLKTGMWAERLRSPTIGFMTLSGITPSTAIRISRSVCVS